MTLLDGGFQALANRGAHSWDGIQVQRLLDGAPVGFRHEHCGMALAGDLDGFMGIGDIVQERVQSFSSLSSCDAGHIGPFNL
ncbi:protein of unknown function [Candidatus Methylomirabilis oxygeniifera]|uniref:Uncharacterized protein n=1 Tax=Methylomirabilis oxygeniifera TaxID=671143 RepID=D5MMJ4_METO1|nr:protein of unknown function [Candidatus Methylomirabilis oxyfera]